MINLNDRVDRLRQHLPVSTILTRAEPIDDDAENVYGRRCGFDPDDNDGLRELIWRAHL